MISLIRLRTQFHQGTWLSAATDSGLIWYLEEKITNGRRLFAKPPTSRRQYGAKLRHEQLLRQFRSWTTVPMIIASVRPAGHDYNPVREGQGGV